MNKGFWNNKSVLITGHNGFKGTWLVKWLDMLGAKTIGFSLEAEKESGINGLILSSKHIEIIGDVRNISDLSKIKDYNPEIVVHLAAQAIVGKAKENPLETFETNLMGTVNLFEVLRETESVKSIVIVTSDKVYNNIETSRGYVEEDSLMGSEPYSCSKVCEEQAAEAYYNSYFKEKNIGVAVARASNAFGGGDYHFDRLIPYLQSCRFHNVAPSIRNPKSVRPWQYVLDLLNGYMVLAEKLYEDNSLSGAYNFGPSREELVTVGKMADMICHNSIEIEKQNYYEAGLLFINSSKSYEKLGWKAIFDIKRGLIETTLAYKEYFINGNSNSIYEKRILEFEKQMEVLS